MTADGALVACRQLHLAGARDVVAFKTLVHREPEDERIPGRQAGLHRRQVVRNPTVLRDAAAARVDISLCGRLSPKGASRISPMAFAANAELGGDLHAVASLRTGIAMHRALENA